jgi:hypothetical protein
MLGEGCYNLKETINCVVATGFFPPSQTIESFLYNMRVNLVESIGDIATNRCISHNLLQGQKETLTM